MSKSLSLCIISSIPLLLSFFLFDSMLINSTERILTIFEIFSCSVGKLFRELFCNVLKIGSNRVCENANTVLNSKARFPFKIQFSSIKFINTDFSYLKFIFFSNKNTKSKE